MSRLPATEAPNGAAFTEERTGPQILSAYGGPWLRRVDRASYATYREMRREPTISLARRALVSSVVTGSWSYEASEEGQEDVVASIRDTYNPMRTHILRSALRGLIDFGWIVFEKVWQLKDGEIRLAKLKPLLHDITEIRIDEATGNYAGIRQMNQIGNEELYLAPEETLMLAINVEGTNWYGEGLLESARLDWNDWREANDGASRYDRKVAGSSIWINHPGGKDVAGKTYAAHARDLGAAIQSSGIVSTPKAKRKRPGDSDNWEESWEIKGLDLNGALQPAFVDRLKYIDGRLVRAMGFPERSILEGNFGTKAEAAEHTKFVVNFMEEIENDVVQGLNWHCVNQQLRLNHGPAADGLVEINPSEISTAQRELLTKILEKVMSSQTGMAETVDMADIRAMMEKLGLPVMSDDVETDSQADAIVEAMQGVEQAEDSGGDEAGQIKLRVDAAAVLIRAGFKQAASLRAVGLDPIEHTGLLPVTLKQE